MHLALLALLPTASAIEVLDTDPAGDFDRARLDVGGFLQPRFNALPDDEDVSGELGFSLERARLEVSGRLDADADGSAFYLGTRVGVEYIPEARLRDGYVDVGWSDLVALRAGQFKLGVNRNLAGNDRGQLLPNRPRLTEVSPDREMGAQVRGAPFGNKLEYSLGVFNGEGSNRLANVNRKFLVAGRVVVSPLGGPGTGLEFFAEDDVNGEVMPATVSLGAGAFHNVEGPPGQEVASLGLNGELFAHWRPLNLQGEVTWVTVDNEETALADYDALGAYLQAGLFAFGVPWAQDHTALLLRAEVGDLFRPYAPGAASSPWGEREEEALVGPDDEAQTYRDLAVGLGLYAGSALFKVVQDARLQLVYTIRQELGATSPFFGPALGAGDELSYRNNELTLAAHLQF